MVPHNDTVWETLLADQAPLMAAGGSGEQRGAGAQVVKQPSLMAVPPVAIILMMSADQGG